MMVIIIIFFTKLCSISYFIRQYTIALIFFFNVKKAWLLLIGMKLEALKNRTRMFVSGMMGVEKMKLHEPVKGSGTNSEDA